MRIAVTAEHAVRSPCSGEVVGTVPIHGPAEVDEACRTAKAQLRAHFPQHARAEVLERAAGLIRERADALAGIITAEAGKPITVSCAEVERCAETLTFAAISPFNYPLNLVAHKVAPAIAAGCPVVLKPAPQTPLTGLAFVALLHDAGLPDQWVTVLTDAHAEAAAPLVAHEIPAMITFTGSVGVGWSIAAAASRKRVALELGSNAPLIVERDADIADAARAIARAGFLFSGQNCISVQRVIVHRSRHAELLDALIPAVDQLAVGDPSEESTQIGPMISAGAADRVQDWIVEATTAGGRLLTGGERISDAVLTPAVVDGVDTGVRLWRDEVFGPVVGVVPFDDFEEALVMANDTTLKLQPGLFTADLERAMRAVRELEFGGVHINEAPTFRVDLAPYGGTADAGNTREGPRTAVLEMTELRVVSLPSS
jgi:acyl-CoA reductase-like NAD-dependent aldehyde dehydrogenase